MKKQIHPRSQRQKRNELANQVQTPVYPHHFVDGLGVFNEEFAKRDAFVVGKWPVEGYNFYDSDGVENDRFFGLALDEDQQPELTHERIEKWLGQIKKEFK